jgi:hypothetical protein
VPRRNTRKIALCRSVLHGRDFVQEAMYGKSRPAL